MTIALRLLSAAAMTTSTLNNTEEVGHHPRHSNSDFVVILGALMCALLGATGLAFVIRYSSCFSVVARFFCLQVCFSNWVAQPAPPPLQPPPPPPGLKKAALLSLPTALYSSSSGLAAASNGACSICLVDFTDGDLIRVLPVCGHVFHVICVDEWLCCSSSCPCCRGLVPLVVAQCKLCGGCSDSNGGAIVESELTLT